MVVSKPLSSTAPPSPSPQTASDTIYVLNKLKAMREEVQMFEDEDNDNFERLNVWTPGMNRSLEPPVSLQNAAFRGTPRFAGAALAPCFCALPR